VAEDLDLWALDDGGKRKRFAKVRHTPKFLKESAERLMKLRQDPEFDIKTRAAINAAYDIKFPNRHLKKKRAAKELARQREMRAKKRRKKAAAKASSLRLKAMWKDPVYRARRTAQITAEVNSPARKKAARERLAKTKQQPGFYENWRKVIDNPVLAADRYKKSKKKKHDPERVARRKKRIAYYGRKTVEAWEAGQKKASTSPEAQAKRSATHKKLWTDPEFKARRVKELAEANKRNPDKAYYGPRPWLLEMSKKQRDLYDNMRKKGYSKKEAALMVFDKG
jgi:hypothetical protein